ncbi:hypothetical protein IQ06DRAFT_374813 [Phaeosphaeriaceae sp. SRC1lsM3a]|nr:hypothetical protein IQ06DRAFT_374813 [Stagonospora sp. SRC1lsM3a]
MRLSIVLAGSFALASSVSGHKVSKDARCGSVGNGSTCLNSRWGSCCSRYNYCGSTDAHCGIGCQSGFGICNYQAPVLSPSIPCSSTISRTSAPSLPSSRSSTSTRSSSAVRASPASSHAISSSVSVPSVPSTVTCGPKPSSCSNLPAASTESCRSVISKSALRVATCEQSTAVVTETVTSLASALRYTSTRIVTATEAVTIPTTAIVTSTSTSIATERVTITVAETVASVSSITATTTTTVSSPAQLQESICTRSQARLRNRATNNIAPACSCFLTTTKDQSASTVFTTTTISADLVAVTETSTVIVSTNVIQTIQQTEATLASSVTTLTDTATTTTIQASTSVVATSTATATTYGDPCATLRPLTGKPRISNGGGVQLRVGRDTTGPEDCCRSCTRLSGCVYYSISYAGTYCQLYVGNPAPSNACRSGQCLTGVQNYDATTPESGTQYWAGTCLASNPGGS